MTRLNSRNLNFILAVFLTISVAGCAQSQYSEFEPALEQFEALLAEGVAADSVGAISAGVVVGDDLIWAKGFGMSDRYLPHTGPFRGRTEGDADLSDTGHGQER